MGPFHITLRVGSIVFDPPEERPREAEPFFDPSAQRLEIALSPNSKIEYPSVNSLGGLGVDFDLPPEDHFSVKGKQSFGSGQGSLSVPAFGPYNISQTGVYFSIEDSLGVVNLAAGGQDVMSIKKEQILFKKPVLAQDDIDVLGNVKADDFILRRVNRVLSPVTGQSGSLVDVIIYDTKFDSDEGQWRERTNYASWANEAAGSTRSGRRKFPAVAIIAAFQNQIIIYDADDITLPIWMQINKNTSSAVTGTINSCDAYNGSLYLGTTAGLVQFDFIRDIINKVDSVGRHRSTASILRRNINTSVFVQDRQYLDNYKLPNNDVRRLSVNYSNQLRPSRTSGVPEPVIDMATATKAVRMQSNFSIYSLENTAQDVIDDTFTNANGDNISFNTFDATLNIVRSHQFTPDVLQGGQVYTRYSPTSKGVGIQLATDANKRAFSTQTEVALLAIGHRGTQNGVNGPMLTYISENPVKDHGMQCMITGSWLSPWSVGAAKGSWLCNSKTLNRIPVAGALTENGLVTGAFTGNSEIEEYFGFSDANYFSIPYSTNITIPNGDWSFIWHQKVATTANKQVIFEMASTSYTENYMSMFIEAETGKAVFEMRVAPFFISIKSDIPAAINENTVMTLTRRGFWITLQMNRVTLFSIHLLDDAGKAANLNIQYNGVTSVSGSPTHISRTDNLALANTSATLYIGRAANPAFSPFSGRLSMFRFSHNAPDFLQVNRIMDWEADLLRNTGQRKLLNGSATEIRAIDGDEYSGRLALATNYGVFIYSRFSLEEHLLVSNSQLPSNDVKRIAYRRGSLSVISGTQLWIDLPEIKIREFINAGSRKIGRLQFSAVIGGNIEEFGTGTGKVTRTQIAVIPSPPPQVPIVVEIVPVPAPPPPVPPPLPLPEPPPPVPPQAAPVNSITLFTGNNFDGTSATFTETSVPEVAALNKTPGFNWNNQARSIRCVGNWRVYKHIHFSGKNVLLTTGEYTGNGGELLDQKDLRSNITSFRLEQSATPSSGPSTTGQFDFSGIDLDYLNNFTFGVLGGSINTLINSNGSLTSEPVVTPTLDERYSITAERDTATDNLNVYLNHPASVPAVINTSVGGGGGGGGLSDSFNTDFTADFNGGSSRFLF